MNRKLQTINNLFIKSFIITIILVKSSYSQNYIWPVKAEKALTAIFGEERPGRYHTGIDIRTFGEIGHPLQAIESGYISRIQTSSRKYGKTIYLTLDDGNTVVYAHLDHFMPELDNLVNALHQYYQKYTIDHYFDNKEHIIKKGDIIGYSGDTGGVSGPHLHFEIRDQNQQPINPFLYGLSIKPKLLVIKIVASTGSPKSERIFFLLATVKKLVSIAFCIIFILLCLCNSISET